jgi:hypothetical protein
MAPGSRQDLGAASGAPARSPTRLGWPELLCAGLLLPPLVYLLHPLSDQDLFWHLATGRWIVEHRSLPGHDPFSFTTPGELDARAHFLLTGYWAAQVLYHGLFTAAGWNGIVGLRLPLLGLVVAFVVLRARGAAPGLLLGLLAAGLLVLLRTFALDRPNAFSFVGFAIVLHVFAPLAAEAGPGGRAGGLSRARQGLAIGTMLVWANLHGGHLLGQAAILVCLASEGLKLVAPRLGAPLPRPAFLRYAGTGLAALAASLLNPNLAGAAPALLATTDSPQFIVEYLPTPEFFRRGSSPQLVLYWAILAGAGAVLAREWLRGRADLREAVLGIGLGVASFSTLRLVPFFLVWAIPYLAVNLSAPRRLAALTLAVGAVVASAGLSCLLLLGDASNLANGRRFATGRWVDPSFPEAAAAFVERNGLPGGLFNYYDWGGYLLWRLGPQRPVAIDNRVLDEDTLVLALAVTAALEEPRVGERALYRAMLDRWGVQTVILPLFDSLSNPIPLVGKLSQDPDWAPVFVSGNSLVLVRVTPRTRALVERRSGVREQLLEQLRRATEAQGRLGSGSYSASLTKAPPLRMARILLGSWTSATSTLGSPSTTRRSASLPSSTVPTGRPISSPPFLVAQRSTSSGAIPTVLT